MTKNKQEIMDQQSIKLKLKQNRKAKNLQVSRQNMKL